MSSFQDSQAEPVPLNTNSNKQNFLNSHVDIAGVRIPNIVLIILLIVVAWYLFNNNGNRVHRLSRNLVGGALETSSSPSSSFFDNIHL